MKKLILIILALTLIFSGCKDSPTEEQAQVAIDDPPTVVVETPEEEDEEAVTEEETTEEEETPAPEAVVIEPPVIAPPEEVIAPPPYIMSFNGSNGIQFFDGINWHSSIYEKQIGPNKYMVDDEIHTLDNYGDSTSFYYAQELTELAKGDVLCDIMSGAEVTDLGARPATYSQIWTYNGTNWDELGGNWGWLDNNWQCSKIETTVEGEVLIYDINGAIHTLGASTGISRNTEGLFIHDYNTATRTGSFTTSLGTTQESWATNFLNQDVGWVKVGTDFYNGNGYKYSLANGLQEDLTPLTAFQSYPYPVPMVYPDAPVLVSIGTFNNVVYFLECSTGYLVEYRIATGQLITNKQIFVGDGTRASGHLAKKVLNPYFVDGVLYFSHGGNVSRYDIASGSVGVLLAGSGEMAGY